MAPLPQNNTARAWVDYNDGQQTHSLMMRFNEPTVSNEAAIEALANFFVAAATLLYEVTILGARISAQGSDVSFPQAWTGETTYGDSALPAVFAPRETRFLGRSLNGRKVSWSLYGGKYTTPDDYRLTALDDAGVASVLSYLDSVDSDGIFLTISGHKPIRYPYADINFNSYWEMRVRS